MHVPAVCLPCVHRMLTVCAGKSMVKVDPCMCEAASVHEFKLGANGGGAATTGTAATTGAAAAAAAAAAMAVLHARGLTNNRQLGASSYVPHRRATVEEARGAVLEAATPHAPGCNPAHPRLRPHVYQAGGAVLLHYAVCDLEVFWRKRWAALGYASPNHRFRGAP